MKAGDKVVCVDDGPGKGKNHLHGKPSGLKRGQVYYLTAVWAGNYYPVIVSVAGVKLPKTLKDKKQIGFRADRFRLVSEVGHPPVQIAEPVEV